MVIVVGQNMKDIYIYDVYITISVNLQTLAKSLRSERGKLYPVKCDVSKEPEVTETFKWVKANLGGVDILINNAGVGSYNTLTGIYDTRASTIRPGANGATSHRHRWLPHAADGILYAVLIESAQTRESVVARRGQTLR
jgi:NAD(P)-dependent dehydrogenase (short-subunit alcohol dehydrogenase family)